MTYSILMKYENEMREIAEALHNILKVDVEIIDNNLFKIAATGRLKYNLGKVIKGNISCRVLEEQTLIVVNNPGQEDICQNCSEKFDCKQKMEISAPIIYEKKVVGVIGVICYTSIQKAIILENIDKIKKSLNVFCDLISSKIYQTERAHKLLEKVNFLEKIVNDMKKGVILVNYKDEIISINNRALYLLNLNPENIAKSFNIIGDNQDLEKSITFKLNISNKNYEILGQYIKIDSLGFESNKILIFDEVYDTSNKNSEELKNLLLIGESKEVKNLKENIKKASEITSSVLISGESGSNLEDIARAIHNLSDKRNLPFEIIQCGNYSTERLNEEFYGRFDINSSSGIRFGKFEFANGGTIFLNDIDKLPIIFQYDLLKIIKNSSIIKPHSEQEIPLKVRVIAGSNLKLSEMIENNLFNKELYYRLNVIPIKIPPLKERKEDIEIIIDNLIKKYSDILKIYVHKVEDSAKTKLLNYSWPGNWQELESCIEFLVNLSGNTGKISDYMLPEYINNDNFYIDADEIKAISKLEKAEIIKALNKFGNTTSGKKLAAKSLEIGIATLYRKIESYKIESELKYK